MVATKLLLGSEEPSIFPVARPPYRSRSKLAFFLTLYGCPFGHQALLEKLPKRDCQSASQRDDSDLATAHAGAGKPLPPPGRQGAFRLVAQPRPGQLDQRLPRELCAGLADAAIPADVTARVRRRRQPDERRQVSSVLETAMVDLGYEKECGGVADAARFR